MKSTDCDNIALRYGERPLHNLTGMENKALRQAIALRAPQMMDIPDTDGSLYHGGTQDWYPTRWQRRAGCAPTTAATLLYYMARRHPGLEALCPSSVRDRKSFQRLMEEMWRYVTPTCRGVDRTAIFSGGVSRYATDRDAPVETRTLDILPRPACRPSDGEVLAFLGEALEADLPVAFLNLSNGGCENLDSWHWVALVSVEPETLVTELLDEGVRKRVDLARWLHTSHLGGGFVYLAPGSAKGTDR